ncbi:hypothetical protein FOZ61_006995 [Perkinsus olseni]|uniref:Uncharacterized protein n=1 Tax=Perkinsus olseni TaxID=32597 RepID=A0A7J6LB46_PEROL|nr:hypothetical protein FOZ61_006995 [Perkinsus olseni]KAF4659827.1 hypothetical protein FOL46_006445 [Perkinsus olseni]
MRRRSFLPFGRHLLYLAIPIHGEPLILPEGIYLSGIEIDARESTRGSHGKVKLKLLSTLPNYDLLIPMHEHCELELPGEAAIFQPGNLKSKHCLQFAPVTSDQQHVLYSFISAAYAELGITVAPRTKVLKRITICSVEGKGWTVYLGRGLASRKSGNTINLIHPVMLEYSRPSSSLVREDHSPAAANEAFTLTRRILPRPGTLVEDGEGPNAVHVFIKEMSIEERQAEMIITSILLEPTDPIINEHHMKYTYRDVRFSENITALSLPPLPLIQLKDCVFISYSAPTSKILSAKLCWRIVIDEKGDESLRGFATSAAEALRVAKVDVKNILLCYMDPAWQLIIGPKLIKMKYNEEISDVESAKGNSGSDKRPSVDQNEGASSKRVKLTH